MNKYFQAASGTWGDFQLFHLVLSAAVADCVYLHFALQLSSSDPPVSRPRTTGPLGMGISNAVGLAAAEAHLAAVPWRSRTWLSIDQAVDRCVFERGGASNQWI